jgi:diketogulonate reductase-like aldo/keto reductase
LMAYSPLGAGELIHDPKLIALATEVGLTPAQLALTWVLRQPNAVAIPKTVHLERLKENLDSANLVMDSDLLDALNRIFPAPTQKKPLMVI